MKKLVIIIIFFNLFVNVHASHITSGALSYTAIKAANGTTQVDVELLVLSDPLGLLFTGPLNAYFFSSSSCGNSSIIIPLIIDSSNAKTPYGRRCIQSDRGLSSTLRSYHLSGRFTLPSNICADGRMVFTVSDRSSIIANLTNPGSSGVFYYADVMLNNNFTQNSTPKFRTINIWKESHKNGPVYGIEPLIDPDGDSLHIEVTYALNYSSQGTNTPVITPFASGYSITNPVRWNGFLNLNTTDGTFNYVPLYSPNINISRGNILPFKILEYRRDSITNNIVQVGETHMECFINLLAISDTLGKQVKLERKDTILVGGTYFATQALNCNDSVFNLTLTSSISIDGLSSDNTEFYLLNLKTNFLEPIKEVKVLNPKGGFSNELEIKLIYPLNTNDTLALYIKSGSDGDIFYDLCGNTIKADSTMLITVSGCPNVSLKEPIATSFSVFPNPVNSTLNLRFSALTAGTKMVQIYTPSGNLVYSSQATANSNTVQLDMQDFVTGLYFIKVTNEKGTALTKRFVKY